MEELAQLCDKDVSTEETSVSPSTILPSDTFVDDNNQCNDDDDNLFPSMISPMVTSRKLHNLDQLYSVSKGSHLKNGVKFLIHMCNTHYLSLSDNHQRLIQVVISKGEVLDGTNFPFKALDKELFGLFANYLVNHARQNQDSTKKELKYGTLDNYFSGVKTWFTEQHPIYSLLDHPVCFTRDWRRLRANLLRAAKKTLSSRQSPIGITT